VNPEGEKGKAAVGRICRKASFVYDIGSDKSLE